MPTIAAGCAASFATSPGESDPDAGALRTELRTAIAAYVAAVLLFFHTHGPARDLAAALTAALAWRLRWLPLQNRITEEYYGTPPRSEADVRREYRDWGSRALGLAAADLEPLATVPAGASPFDAAAAGLTDLETRFGTALTTRMERTAAHSGAAVTTAAGRRFDPEQVATFLTRYAPALALLLAYGSSEKVRRLLLAAQAKGLTPEETAAELRSWQETDFAAQAERVAGNETWRAHIRGQVAGLTQIGALRLIFVTAGDERVCAVCEPLDGAEVDPSEGPFPPLHSACRCEVQPDGS